MKLWVDDVRPAPEGWEHVHSVNEAVGAIALEAEIHIKYCPMCGRRVK